MSTYNVQDIKARVDCRELILALGADHRGGDRYTCPWRPGSDGQSVAVQKDQWYDHVGKNGGDCILMVELAKGISFTDALEWLSEWVGMVTPADPQPQRASSQPVAFYDYTDEQGRMLYQSVRYEPKTFKQRKPDGNGGWIWTVKDCRLVPYRLPAVLAAECVWIVEGEKDANTLVAAGECATCNVGGAGKWLEGYSEFLRGKEVVLCGDNDAPGRAHMAKVLETLAGKVAKVTHVTVPAPNKDISDYLATVPAEGRVQALDALCKDGKHYPGGVDLPIMSVRDMGIAYKAELDRIKREQCRIDIADWLPSLRNKVRRMVPGEVCTIIADTGVGKSMILQNIAFHCHAPTLFFELELPETLLFERFAAMALGETCSRIEEAFSTGPGYDVPGLEHVYCCPVSRMSIDTMRDIINKAELRMGRRPAAVMIDYIQLLDGKGERYERTSDAAESIKRLAKETRTVVFVASQRSRGQEVAIKLHDAKDSGAIENSSGLILGAWRDPASQNTLLIKVLKNTKGSASEAMPVRCRIIGAEMRIEDETTDSRRMSAEDVARAAGESTR